YARWQDLLDRNDVQGLVAFAATPDGLAYKSTLVAALGEDLLFAQQYSARRAYLRAAVERYPRHVRLRLDLAHACTMPTPRWAEALHHGAAAPALVPDSAWVHLLVGSEYAGLGATSQAVAAYRKVIAMSPSSSSAVQANYWMGEALVRAKDWEGAIPPLR